MHATLPRQLMPLAEGRVVSRLRARICGIRDGFMVDGGWGFSGDWLDTAALKQCVCSVPERIDAVLCSCNVLTFLTPLARRGIYNESN